MLARAICVGLLMSACADVLSLRDGHAPPAACISNDECAPGQTCHEGRCAKQCREGELRCNVLEREVCGAGGEWSPLGETCASACSQGACVPQRSCEREPLCGAERVSCCEARAVPGGTFALRNGSDVEFETTVERTVSPFAMDRFEVTYGRFRQFASAYSRANLPSDGDGAVAHSPHSGWQAAWNDNRKFMPSSHESLEEGLRACGQPTENLVLEQLQLPVRCVNWYLAFAFCIWDGGRLPTEAEWTFAAEGGDERRTYPWSTPEHEAEIGPEDAHYSDLDTSRAAPAGVGLHPAGASRFGHEDLAGNVWEWVADWYHTELRESGCETEFTSITDRKVDCVELQVTDSRVQKGGSYANQGHQLTNERRYAAPPDTQTPSYGFRCVHTSQ
jgi:sulfatase modifying factor 1